MANGQLITVFAAKGGCGKTTLATNLATVLHDRGAHRVCLFDLDLEFGDAAGVLGLRSERSMMDALSYDAAGDPSYADLTPAGALKLMTPYRPGLDCLLAPTRPGEAALIPVSLVSRLLEVLPLLYDFVVVDTPSRFSTQVLAALDAADHHVLVTTPDRPALKNLRATIDVLDLLQYDRTARSIVVNRSDAAADLPDSVLDELVRSPIAGHLPSWNGVPASINRGEPLVAADRDHPVSLAIRQLAAALLPTDGRCSRDPPPG
ncbi:AAA family ATPase [Kribbella qitaiheensis]|uniref:AAA family ATPase n=1 Tax=Kribbella qitaiheensis TaxID=1544730 RepID=A0A7G6WWG5_9ACTN|nr:AAA family ATPase [Kribbella qitaiheensis]QNE18330.1 AAA family ATPase [Kribbella qitaiheensis]